ncbi:unnamed protein product [Ascophyllum nodosum]
MAIRLSNSRRYGPLLKNSCDRKSHWGLPEIPRGSAALTEVTRDSDAVLHLSALQSQALQDNISFP